MVVQLNPRFPLVWRSPTSLQFGIDAPPIVLHEVTNAQERIIATLVAGASRPGLSLIAETAGATEADLVDLLDRLEPILATSVPAPSGTVAVIGTSSTAGRLRTALTAVGCTVGLPSEPAELGILISHYVIEPELFGYWLRRDTPHLPIVFSDTGVRIGPFIEPGSGPCLYCLDRHRTDADPAWPAIASQLWGKTSPAEDTILTAETVAMALRLVSTRLAGSPAEPATSVFLDAATGETTRRQWQVHPECGCGALPENGSAHDQRRDPARRWTTRGAAVGVPA